MAKNYFSRYIWLIDLIRRRGYISLPEINQAWKRSSLNESGSEIPERTFFNHKAAIADIFGIELKCDRELGYYISEQADADSVRSLLMQSLFLNNIVNESATFGNRILLEKNFSGYRFLTDIIMAMREGRALYLIYQNFKDDEAKNIEVEPYCVKEFKQRWYLLAKSGETLKIYSLDRILDMEESERAFEIPDDFDTEGYFKKYYGVITKEEAGPEDVLIKVNASQVPYFRSLPLHQSQSEIETHEEYSIFYYALVPMYDFRKELLSNGADVEVLNPHWFREWIADEAKKMEEIYHD